MDEAAFKKAFGKRLRFLRELRDLTQARLAERIGVTEQYISMLERGLSAPSFALITQLSRTLQAHPASLFLFARLDEAGVDPLPLPTLPENLSEVATWSAQAFSLQDEEMSPELAQWLVRPGAVEGRTGRPPSLFAFVPPEDALALRDALARAATGRPMPLFSFRMQGARPMNILAYAALAPGDRVRLVLMDFTDHLRLRQTQHDLQAEVAALVAQRTQQMQDTVAELEAEVARRRLSEAALADAEATSRTLFDHAPVGIFHTLPEGRFLAANREFAAMLGYEHAEDLLQVQDIAQAHYADPARRQEFVERMAKHGEIQDFEMKAKDRHGREFWLSITARTLPAGRDSLARAFIGFAEDITARKAVDALLDDMARLARHEMAGPLHAGVNALRQLAQADNLTAEQRDLLAEGERAGERAQRIVTLARQLMHLELGSAEGPHGVALSDRPRLDLAALLRGILEDIRLFAGPGAPQVRLGLPDRPVFIRGDEALCHAMFFNVIKNALQAVTAGQPVDVTLACGEDVVVTVRNEGSIPERLAPVFFDKDVSHDRPGGMGLGAYIARRIARALGGDMRLAAWQEGEIVVETRLPAA